MKRSRIPVWLVTGYLGSGKTTLLAHWLRDPALAGAALVVNEIGEVALDDALLAQSLDSAALITNACVCCTGLPGLEEALLELWWDRLQRRRAHFDAVVIETTGLADPAPVIAAFGDGQPLAERYRLAAIVTTTSASAGAALIDAHPEAQAQLRAADAVVITKQDLADGTELAALVRRLNPHAGIAWSAHASVGWGDITALLGACAAGGPAHRPDGVPAQQRQHHHHDATACFLPLPDPVTVQDLQRRLQALQQEPLLRLKGVVQLVDGSLQAVQWSAGDTDAAIRPFAGNAPRLGLTCIQPEPQLHQPPAAGNPG